jgi:DNA-binding transcriptional LysR family regulator
VPRLLIVEVNGPLPVLGRLSPLGPGGRDQLGGKGAAILIAARLQLKLQFRRVIVQKRSTLADVNWDDLRIFLAVHRTGSFAEAGRALSVNATTIGRRLERLEAALGATLFHRTFDGLTPTANCEAILARAQEMERASSLILGYAGGDDARLDGTVSISVTPTYASHFLLRHMGAFSRKHPHIHVDIATTDVVIDVARGDVDLAVRFRPPGAGPAVPETASVIARPIGAAGIAVYASRDYVEAKGTPRDAYDLEGHLVILPNETAHPLHRNEWFEAAAERADAAIFVSDMESMAAGAVAGLGLACIPTFFAIDHPKLVAIRPPHRIEHRDMWLLMPSDLKRVARVRALRDFIIELHESWASLLSGEMPAA